MIYPHYHYYLAGPMSGYEDHNFPYFNEVATKLRLQRYKITNPAEINIDKPDRATCMRKDLEALLKCNAIMLLPGWQHSRGARLEFIVAQDLGYHIDFWRDEPCL